MGLEFRNLMITDAHWLTEVVNDPEVAEYSLSVYPKTEFEVEEVVKKELEDNETKHVVAELDREPAGSLSVWWRPGGRDQHVAWLAMAARRKYWGKGAGSGLMKEAIRIAKELGCRKLMLGTFEGNERAIHLYRKFGFKSEGYEKDEVYIEGSWRKNLVMGLELAPCTPKHDTSSIKHAAAELRASSDRHILVRQLENRDMDEVQRLQNCPESTKSSYRVPPVTREQTRKWYEGLKGEEGKYCFACFKAERLLGYLQFRTYRLPFPCLKFEEIIVDANQKPVEAAEALIDAIRGFKERYWYRRIFAYTPEANLPIVSALERQGFKKTGAMKDYLLIDEHYVNLALYGYP